MERVAIESRAIIVKLLENLEKELIAKVADGVTDWSKARIDKQLKEASTVIKQYYDDAAGIAKDTTTNVAQVSASATTDSLLMAVGNQVAMAAIPTASYLETLAGNTIIQGAVQRDWWSRQSEDTVFKFQSAVRQGLVAAETTPQIVKRVRGVLDISKRNAETLVHTSVQSVANTTREKIFADNDDVMSGKEWSSALDRRTCPTCGALDGKRWTTDSKPISHSMAYQIPPKHFRCRCSMIPVLKTWKELGINMDELSDNTRASMEGQVNDKTFEDWLKRKTESDPTFADRTLGKGRAELWRNGKITMDQMISGGQPLTLSQLQAKYGKAIPERKVFVPAKSMTEAKDRMMALGVKNADISRFTEPHYNKMLEVVENIPKKSIPSIITDKIGYESVTGFKMKRKQTEWMGLSSTHEIINKETFKYSTERIVVINNKGFTTPSKMTARKIEYNDFYASKKDGNKWYFNEFDGSTHYHETGHIYDNGRISTQQEWINISDKWHKESKVDLLKVTTGEWVGKQGSEAFAEAFASYFGNNKIGLPDYVIKYFDENIK
jgi:SPP1 gp7 family putative phage head morphogenesis protein